jgi:hypothetical protein
MLVKIVFGLVAYLGVGYLVFYVCVKFILDKYKRPAESLHLIIAWPIILPAFLVFEGVTLLGRLVDKLFHYKEHPNHVKSVSSGDISDGQVRF